jgi:hypothetical protein
MRCVCCGVAAVVWTIARRDAAARSLISQRLCHGDADAGHADEKLAISLSKSAA